MIDVDSDRADHGMMRFHTASTHCSRSCARKRTLSNGTRGGLSVQSVASNAVEIQRSPAAVREETMNTRRNLRNGIEGERKVQWRRCTAPPLGAGPRELNLKQGKEPSHEPA